MDISSSITASAIAQKTGNTESCEGEHYPGRWVACGSMALRQNHRISVRLLSQRAIRQSPTCEYAKRLRKRRIS